MKLLRDIPDTIVLNATKQKPSSTKAVKNKSYQSIKLTKKTNEEAMKDLQFTLYSSRGRR
jgi:hypothetical protein